MLFSICNLQVKLQEIVMWYATGISLADLTVIGSRIIT